MSSRTEERHAAAVTPPPPAGGLVPALSRLDALLRARVAQLPDRPDAFRGLVITPEEALYLALAPGLATAQLHEPVEKHGDGGPRQGAVAVDPLARIAAVFELSPLDVDLVVLAVAPELDLRYQKLFGFLQDDVTRTRPTVGFALDLLLGSDLARLAQLHRAAEDSPAIAHGLLRVEPDARDPHPPLAGRVLVADAQVLRWLTGAAQPDPRVRAVCAESSASALEVLDAGLARCPAPAEALSAARREARFRGVELRLPGEAARDLARGEGAGTSPLGHPLDTSVGWADLVLPDAQTAALRELCERVRHRERVLDEWGFGRGLLGRGVLGLFAGPSGTGKTLAARVVAAELGLPLHRVDVSQVVSKYIGETEKNLAKVFGSAAGTGAVLLFDEADALFGKRTEVRDSHDRYANQEVAYLLARVEEYDGLALLTTNLSDNIDTAFLRRVTSVVPFPMPDPEARRRMWQQVWPTQELLHPDVDLDAVAQHRLSGAGIRDAALTAAFLAASDEAPVTPAHLDRAVVRELVKAGRVHAPGPEGETVS